MPYKYLINLIITLEDENGRIDIEKCETKKESDSKPEAEQ